MSLALQPLAWIAITSALTLLLMNKHRKLALVAGWLSFVLIVILGWHKPANYLFRQLESQFPEIAPGQDLSSYAGVVVLGGAFESPVVWQAHPGMLALNEGAERITTAVSLSQQFPKMRVIFSGGLNSDTMSEADRARIAFTSLGVAPDRITYESRSTTTYENAIFSARIHRCEHSTTVASADFGLSHASSDGVFSKGGLERYGLPS